MPGELELLGRAHALFAGASVAVAVAAAERGGARLAGEPSGALSDRYHLASVTAADDLVDSHRSDAGLSRVLAAARGDHDRANHATATVLAAARADNPMPDSPLAARELLRRRILRLRAQRAHVLAARRRARRNRAALLALRYRSAARRRGGADSRARVAVRAALSRLGCPYVWGATGPDRFDCSGLVMWAYAQAGVQVHRTTYDQINDGVPVARAQVRPGDLVFPHVGHVQMAIGHNLVVEAPQPGAAVQISPLGSHVAIRRLL